MTEDTSLTDSMSLSVLNRARIQSDTDEPETPLSNKIIQHRLAKEKKTTNNLEQLNFKASLQEIIKQSNRKIFQTPSKQSQKKHLDFTRTMTAKIKRKNAVLYEQICPICLHEYEKDKAKLSCGHQFCFQCIKGWAESATVCPCCRKLFTQIIKNNTEKIQVPTKQLKINQQDYFLCYNCGRGDNEHVLLICDCCQFYCCHIYCDASLNNTIPQIDWYCKYCQQKLQIQPEQTEPFSNLQISVISEEPSQKEGVAHRTRSRESIYSRRVNIHYPRGNQLRRFRQARTNHRRSN